MINPDLSLVTFKAERQSVQEAFGEGTVRVETLPKGFRLFKLTAGEAQAGRHGVTGWWSPVYPFKEDYEGALGRYNQAKLNGIDMSAMTRFMSAVSMDWNDLDNYVEVTTRDSIKVYWGTFAPQGKWNDDGKASAAKERWLSRGGGDASSADLPDTLGVLEAWQFYIPNLKDEHILRSSVIPSHDMVALGMYLGKV